MITTSEISILPQMVKTDLLSLLNDYLFKPVSNNLISELYAKVDQLFLNHDIDFQYRLKIDGSNILFLPVRTIDKILISYFFEELHPSLDMVMIEKTKLKEFVTRFDEVRLRYDEEFMCQHKPLDENVEKMGDWVYSNIKPLLK